MTTITGHFDGKVIVPDEPLDLPVNQRVLVHVRPVAEGEQPGPRHPNGDGKRVSVLEWIAEHVVDDPSIPSDLSYQHDHYLYGTPKKPGPGF